jgi:hypothetical protein
MAYLFREEREGVNFEEFIRRNAESSFYPEDIIRGKKKVNIPAAEVETCQFPAATEPEAVIYP